MKGSNSKLQCFRVAETNDERELENKFNDIFDKDFVDDGTTGKYSVEEQSWLEFVENNTNKIGDNFQISLPIKENIFNLTNNYFQVKNRFKGLSQQLKNTTLCQEYCSFMKLMEENGVKFYFMHISQNYFFFF